MTPQEKQLLEGFLADMVAARSGPKDPEADALIREAVSRQPDATYLLVQRALQLDQVLQMREAEVRKLQADLADARAAGGAPPAGGSFIGDPYAWGSRGAAAPQSSPSAGSASIPGTQRAGAQAQQPQMAQQPPLMPQQPARSGWGGAGMLGTVATTAAGVVAGSFLYQGIQGLMHRNDPAADATHAAGNHAQPLLGDSNGFNDVVPDDSELLSAADDDSDLLSSSDDTDFT